MNTLTTLSEATPVEIDTKLSELHQKLSVAKVKYDRIQASLIEAEQANFLGNAFYTPYTDKDANEAYKAYHKVYEEIAPLEAEYEARPWSRYYHVNNSNGHIHRNISCSTCFPDTQYLWRTDLSGLTEEEVVEMLAHNACSVCMPIAPAVQKEARKAYNAEVREAKRVEKEAKKDEKLRNAAVRAQKLLDKADLLVAKHFRSWDAMYSRYSLYGDDNKDNLYGVMNDLDLPAQVFDYIYDEMMDRQGQKRYSKDPKETVRLATEKGLI